MENFFLNLGFGWTSSKIIPFVVMLLLGIGLYLIALKFAKEKWMRITALVLILIPAFIYMVFNPIYEGDFSDTYRIESETAEHFELEDDKLTVLMLPGCSYCEASIEQLKILKSRLGPKKEIDVVVCTLFKDDLKFFEEKSEGKLNIKISLNSKAMSELAENQFPSFVYKSKGRKLRVWSNNQFGPSAKDWLEEQYK